jgi:hypothetical protein
VSLTRPARSSDSGAIYSGAIAAIACSSEGVQLGGIELIHTAAEIWTGPQSSKAIESKLFAHLVLAEWERSERPEKRTFEASP